eukprot:3034176-Ditylum_brightwellii.AAC.1
MDNRDSHNFRPQGRPRLKKPCQFYDITLGEIIVGYNEKGALRKAMDKAAKLRASPIIWNWQHGKGYQDDHMGPLDKFESLNIEMVILAKIRRSK